MGSSDNPVEDVINGFTQVVTGGAVGIKDGQLIKGYTARGIDEVVGEVSGRNAARQASAEQRQALQDQAAEQRRLRNEELIRQNKADLNLSKQVGSARSSRGSSGDVSKSGQQLGGNMDLLGLG